MFEILLRYASVFAWHGLIGLAAIVFVAWFAYAAAKFLGWHMRGTRGPLWLPGLVRVGAWCVILLTAAATGLQTGTAQALARGIKETATESALAALVKVGSTIDITDADQKISLQDAERLAERFAPSLLNQSKIAISHNSWFGKASAVWEKVPQIMKGLINRRAPKTQTTPRELVQLTWRYSAAPLVEAGKQQALIFAYSSGLLVLVIVLTIEWLYLAWTRRPDALPQRKIEASD